MRIHRLLGIVIYLLSHEAASSRLLAERFEVSRRTIQRDIDAINLAGIPIVSTQGSRGGYGVVEAYKLDRQLASPDDYVFIVTALKGLYSAFRDNRIDATLEKLLSLSPSQTAKKQTVFLDFSVMRERADIVEIMKLVEGAITHRKAVEFDYTDTASRQTHRLVEPVALTYRWYAWYVFGYCRTRGDYRLFKLLRITNLSVTETRFVKEHGSPEELMKRQDTVDNRRGLDIKLLCKAEARVAVLEYLHGRIVGELENGDFILAFRVPENERMWFSLLLGFGDKLAVLEPLELRDRLTEKASEITRLYRHR